jgi:hypothetical protein
MNKKYYSLPIIAWAICFLTPLSSQTPTASFATWKDNKKAAYTIIHDDYSDYVTGIYQYADPIATARGIKLCFGAITSACGPTEWTKARTMISHGHECVNHTHNHFCGGSASQCTGLTTYGPANFATELDLSTQLIESNTGVRPRFFIHPYDASSGAILNYLTSIGYLGSRAGSQLITNPSTFTNFMNLNFYVYDGTAAALTSLNTAVNSAISSGGYAVREFHGIADGSWSAMTVANYTSHLDYVKTKITDGSLWSATATEAITYKMQRDAFAPVVAYNAAANTVTVSFSALKTINPSVLRTPVTLNVNVTGFTPSILNASQNGSAVTYTRVGNILSFNVYPHLGNVVINVGAGSPPPVNITNLVATPQTNAVLLGWTNPATTFDEVMVVAKASTGFTTIPSGTTYTANANFTGASTAFETGKVVYRGVGNSLTVTGLTGGTNYFFRVYTRSGTAWSTGLETSAVPTSVVLPPPVNITNLVGTPQANAVLLGWTSPATAYDEVMIVAKATTGFTTTPSGTTYTANANFTGAGTAFEGGKVVYRGTGISMTVTGLTGGTTYFFKVFTRSGTAWSTGVQVSAIPTAAATPANVTNLVATAQVNAASVTWTNPTSTFDEILVVAKELTGFLTTPVGTTYNSDSNFSGTGTAFEGGKVVYRGIGTSVTVTNLVAGRKYFFRAYTRLGTVWSNGVEVSTTPTGTTTTCVANGKLIHKVWNTITLNNYDITDLTTDARFPNSPSSVDTLTQFTTFSTVSFFGDRVLGYIAPTTTGNYTFSIAGADDVQLFLSTDESVANKRSICTIADFTNIGEFTKYPTQKSAAIALTAGKFYYVELLHIQSEGEAHFDVQWQTPTNATLSPIPSANLSSRTCTATTPLLLATAQTATFAGRLDGNKGVLNWATKSADENDYFILEKADEKTGDFKQLDVINAQGRDKSLQAFSYVDENMNDGDNFYRLNTVAQNSAQGIGSGQYSEIINIKYERPDAYAVFPNPAEDYFSIDLSLANGKAVDISVISLLGKVIKTERIQTPSVLHRFELGDLESGQYFIRVQPQGKRMVMKKLMIMK